MKKVIITESQFKTIISNQVAGKKEVIEEGIKDWILIGLMTLASAAGVKAQSGEVTDNHIEAASVVQDRLQSGDKELVKYFDEADIDLNKENLSKLLKVDDEDIKTFKTKYLGTAKAKLKQGYSLESINVTKDTLVSELPPQAKVDTILSIDLSGNLFGVGEFSLNNETTGELNNIIQTIESNGGTINSIIIESSTDKQRISPELDQRLIASFGKGGNEGLSNLRNNKVKEKLISLGVDDSLINQDVKWEQGTGEVGAETPQDPSARYVRVILDVSYNANILAPDDTVGEVVEKVYYVLIKKAEKTGIKKLNRKSSNKTTMGSKRPSCNINLGKLGSLPCPLN